MGIMSDMHTLLTMLLNNEVPSKRSSRKDMESGFSEESPAWRKIVQTIKCCTDEYIDPEDSQLFASLSYELYMTLTHRLADLRSNAFAKAESIHNFTKIYEKLRERYYTALTSSKTAFVLFPDMQNAIQRYLKAVKSATMISNDDIPCLTLVSTINNFMIPESLSDMERNMVIRLIRCIYLENTRMMFTGFRQLNQNLFSHEPEINPRCSGMKLRSEYDFDQRMKQLNRQVNDHLRDCYETFDGKAQQMNLLYQSVLGNFCRFWQDDTGESPAQSDDERDSEYKSVQSITYILQYFHLLDILSREDRSAISIDDLPYFYEELCRSICGFSGAEMCYIAYHDGSNFPDIITQSGYHVETMKNDRILNASGIETVIGLSEKYKTDEDSKDDDKGWTINVLIPGVVHLQNQEEESFLVINIPLPRKDDQHNFYIVLQSAPDNSSLKGEETLLSRYVLRPAKEILFLRQRLQEALARDYTVLINFRFDPSYIRPIIPENCGHPAILHISDLHITTELKDKEPKLFDAIIDGLEKSLNNTRIDLIALTGDIVDGRSSNAPQMEKNYRYAEELLNKISILLWKDLAGYLPHDWKRRFIITTGNHDFAAMNQFKAMLNGRTLAVGVPVDADTGTMSKFSYYIEFLVRYLDPPLDELLNYDLNELRDYRNLNIKALVLNCSSNASPLRTNKMGVDHKLVTDLLQRKAWSPRKDIGKVDRPLYICLAHYAPGKEISYLIDNYHTLPGWNWSARDTEVLDNSNAMNYFAEVFMQSAQGELSLLDLTTAPKNGTEPDTRKIYREELRNNQKVRRDLFIKEFERLSNAMQDLIKTKDIDRINASQLSSDPYYFLLRATAEKDSSIQYAHAIENLIVNIKNNDLYQQIERYYNWLHSEQCPNDEHILSLFHEIDSCIKMSRFDQLCFEKTIHECDLLDYYLAGHVHAYQERTFTVDGGLGKQQIQVLVADRLFYGVNSGINGYILRDCAFRDGKNMTKYMRLY